MLTALPVLTLGLRVFARIAGSLSLYEGADCSQGPAVFVAVRAVFVLSLSFFPPEGYLRRVREGAAAG